MDGVRNRKRRRSSGSSDVYEESIKSSEGNTNFILPQNAFYGFLLVLIFLYCVIIHYNEILPPMLKVTDEIKYPESFIGERAEQDLLKLVSLGPKVTGSFECEVLAVRVIRQEIAVIAQSANPVHLIVQDIQKPKGSFHMALKPHGFQSIYENIQNIAIRIGPNPPSNHSVLINCHFDTVPESPGASDNGLNCAVMLEVLRKLSRFSEPLKHNVIFLFNGAEENVLQAAHGFITKHFWSKEVRVVLNLDAGGAGGREFLFQAAPDHPWLLQAYARAAPRPSASLAGQELFDSGLIPSDTDYRIFRDFGPTPGIDFAHIDNGYIYHTQYDTMDYIEPGVYQHTGDNILALVLELARAPQLENLEAAKVPGSKLVYYDLFGVTMFVYSQYVGVLINLAVVVLVFCGVWNIMNRLPNCQNRLMHSIVVSTSKALLSVVLGTIAALTIAYVLDYFGGTLSWYRRTYLIILLYVFPYVCAASLPWIIKDESGVHQAFEYFCGGQVVSSLALLLLTLYGIRSSYLLMLLCIFPAAAAVMSAYSNSVAFRFAVVIGSSLVGVSIIVNNALTMFYVIIPITGRTGSTLNPEIVIAALTCIVCFGVGNCLIPVLLTVKSRMNLCSFLTYASVICVLLISFTPLGFPYSSNPKSIALQRFYIYHTDQKLYNLNGELVNNSTGVFILPMDRNRLKYVTAEVKELQNAVPANCDRGLLCQFPLYNGRHVNPAKTSVWLPLQGPQIQYETKLELTDTVKLDSLNKRLSFELIGPDHITLVISPRPGVSLTGWTLGSGRKPAEYEGRLYYVVYISDGQVGDITHFSLTLQADEEKEGAWAEVSVVGHYQHQKAAYTTDFKDLVNRFPKWSHVTSWVASVKGYEF